MRGNVFGKMLSMTSFGESHGAAMGVVIDGMPPQLAVSEQDLQQQLAQRAPGKSAGTTARQESDQATIVSGVFEGKTLGSPICVMVKNEGQRPQDYAQWRERPRPGHADQTTQLKFGIRDHRGGGRSSGRETLSRVIGGYFAGLVLPQLRVQASIVELGPFSAPPPLEILKLGRYRFADPQKEFAIEAFLLELKARGESVGGGVALRVENVPPALGEPCFDKLKADLAKALLSVGGVVGFSYGAGDDLSQMLGSQAGLSAQHFGGIEGGISSGAPIALTVMFKPPATVGTQARAGRHDPCIMPRACVVLEAMTTFTLVDHYLRQKAYG